MFLQAQLPPGKQVKSSRGTTIIEHCEFTTKSNNHCKPIRLIHPLGFPLDVNLTVAITSSRPQQSENGHLITIFNDTIIATDVLFKTSYSRFSPIMPAHPHLSGTSLKAREVVSPRQKLDTQLLVSIIVPTYEEAENLPILIPQVWEAITSSGMTAEILVVDDNSQDDTVRVCNTLSHLYPIKLFVRTQERGLSSAVLHGMNQATGQVLLVMDADLSHPPEKVPELVAAILEKQGDFVIGSRYVPGGTTDDSWSFFRWINSKVATGLSRGLTTARDPMAGFFALSRKSFEHAMELNPIGYKIGLELIVKCKCKQVCEVPIHFRDRIHGESKLTLSEQFKYLRHLGRLYRHKMGEWFTPLAFAAVGASGMVVDLVLLSVFMLSLSFPAARALAIFAAMTWNFLGNRYLTFATRHNKAPLKQYLMYCGCSLLTASASWSISTYLWELHAQLLRLPAVAAIVGIAAGVILNYLFSNFLIFPRKRPESSTH
ncbi:MAG: glycosyltransferase family 2 protein [Planctomycetaceae bacterium]|nr:glycosyltransferase family 2 protein [Planctomycetaceae bacterium]